MAPDIECVQYHQWMVRDWTQHEVIRVVPVPGMAVCCQWIDLGERSAIDHIDDSPWQASLHQKPWSSQVIVLEIVGI
jgi:hypothetical protein